MDVSFFCSAENVESYYYVLNKIRTFGTNLSLHILERVWRRVDVAPYISNLSIR
jgi:hypothetical protein